MDRSTVVAIFAYNRAKHLRRTLESLMGCVEFAGLDKILFIDGPKNPDDTQEQGLIRTLVSELKISNLKIISREQNLGLKASVLAGMDHCFAQYKQTIVIEDDLEISKDFIKFCLLGLQHYSKFSEVYSIAGMLPLADINNGNETLCLPLTSSWGWATWQDRWQEFRKTETSEERLKPWIYDFDLFGNYPYSQLLAKDGRGEISSWAIHWYKHVFISGGLVVYPPCSLVSNFGFDGSGTHKESHRQTRKLGVKNLEALSWSKPVVNVQAMAELTRKSQSSPKRGFFQLLALSTFILLNVLSLKLIPRKKGHKIWLYDDLMGGHHEIYLKLYNKLIKNSEVLSPPNIRLRTHKYAHLSSLVQVLHNWNQLLSNCRLSIRNKSEAPQLLFLMWLDDYLHAKLPSWFYKMVLPVKWSGLVVHPQDKDMALKNLAKAQGQVLSLSASPETVLVPDIASTNIKSSSTAQDIQLRSNGKKIILLCGSIEERKGMMLFLSAAFDKRFENYFFVIAGKVQMSHLSFESKRLLRRAIKTLPHSLLLVDKYFTDESELNGVIQLADYIYLNYSEFTNSSNFLFKAAAFKKPVISSPEGLIALTTKKYGLGLVMENNSLEALLGALNSQPPTSLADKFLESNDPSQISKVFDQLLK